METSRNTVRFSSTTTTKKTRQQLRFQEKVHEASTPVRASLSLSRPNSSLNLSSTSRRTASSMKYTDYPGDDKGTSLAEMAYDDEVWSKYAPTQSKHYWEGMEAHDARPDSFGKEYVKKVCDLIQYHMEASIDSRVCYVGDVNGCLADDLERELRLVQPIERRLFDSTAATDAENSFSAVESSVKDAAERALHPREDDPGAGAVYDRVLVKDTIENVRDMQRLKPLLKYLMCLTNEFGRLVLVLRPYRISTLPYYDAARRKLRSEDVDFLHVIDSVQRLGFDVTWKLELVPVYMSPHRWLRMLYKRNPQPLRSLPATEANEGVRALAEGSFKYLPFSRPCEFYDRLLFLYMTHPLVPGRSATVRQADAPPTVATDLSFTVPVTAELEPLVKPLVQRQQREDERERYRQFLRGRTEWWGTVREGALQNLDSSLFPKRRLNNALLEGPHSRTK